MLVHPSRVVLVVAALVALPALSAPAAAQSPRPGDPVWGAYAAGLGYPVNSDALQERASQEGIDPRCLMTVTVAWMEHPRIVENVRLGLLRALVEGVTLTQAQEAMYAHSVYMNSEIDCSGPNEEDAPAPRTGTPPQPERPQPDRCPAERPGRDPDLETGPGHIVQWYWTEGAGLYCGYLRQGGGLHQYTLEPSGNGYYIWGFNRATQSYERVMRMDRGPAPDPSTGWVESGTVFRINADGTLSNVGWWFGRLPR